MIQYIYIYIIINRYVHEISFAVSIKIQNIYKIYLTDDLGCIINNVSGFIQDSRSFNIKPLHSSDPAGVHPFAVCFPGTIYGLTLLILNYLDIFYGTLMENECPAKL